MASADGAVQMKHKQQRWTLITKTAVPLKKIVVRERLCCCTAETFSFCQTGNLFYLRQEDKLMLTLLPSVGHYFLREGFLTNVWEDVTADSSLTFRVLTTAINLLQIHPSSCPPLSTDPLICTLCCPPWADIYARSHGEIWHSCIRWNMGMLETSHNQLFYWQKETGSVLSEKHHKCARSISIFTSFFLLTLLLWSYFLKMQHLSVYIYVCR